MTRHGTSAMMLLADGKFTTGLFLLGMMLIIMAVLRGTKKNMKASKARRLQNDALCVNDTIELRPFTDKPAQLLRWEVEMHDLARDISARLDSKIALLQKLLIAAEEREKHLAGLLAKAAPDAAASAGALAQVNAAPLVIKQDRLGEIYRLADEGRSSCEIAQRVHSAVGDVELILSLPR
jgi:hypothetical protein